MGALSSVMRLPGARLVSHALFVFVLWLILSWVTGWVDPLTNLNIALVGMYATAMFGMVILVGLSGQVSLGNGALMAVGAYSFALTSLNWQTVPIIGVPMNGWWAMIFAGIGGVIFGLIIGGLGARLKGPYLAGLTLGVAVGIPAIANRFPDLFGGENGLMLTVPYPEGGYAPIDTGGGEADQPVDTALPTELPTDLPTSQDSLPGDAASLAPGDMLTASDFPTAAPGDTLTASNFPTAAPGDTLTASNFPSDASTGGTDVGTGADTSGVDTSGTDTSGLDSNFAIEHWQAGLSILVACIALFMALNLVRGRQGSIWRAVRDDPVAAAVSGISPASAKVGAFVVSSLLAALSGGVFAQILAYVGPGAFGLGLSLSLLVGIVLGGRSALLGAVIGAVLLVWLPSFIDSLSKDRGWSDQITNNMPNLIYGLLVVLVVLIAPGGIVGTIQSAVAKARGRVSRGG